MRDVRLAMAGLLLKRLGRENKNMINGAGIVVLKRNKGLCDLPKGRVDQGEKPFATALRETKEEAGITKLDFIWGKKSKRLSNLIFFIATTEQTPKITKNPKSGIYEHDSFEWMSIPEAKEKVTNYLNEAIMWAEEVVNG